MSARKSSILRFGVFVFLASFVSIIIVAAPVVKGEEPDDPVLHYHSEVSTRRADGSYKITVFFQAMEDSRVSEQIVTKEAVVRQLRVDGKSVDPSMISAPRRGGADNDTIPLAFWLGIDVSSSMGPYNLGDYRGQNNFILRGLAMTNAIQSFLAELREQQQRHVYFQLVPFGTTVPQEVMFEPTAPNDWRGRFLSLQDEHYNDLRVGLEDITGFIGSNEKAVVTALWSTLRASVNSLNVDPESLGLPTNTRYVAVILTDANEPWRDDPTSKANAQESLANDQRKIFPYIIAFGNQDPQTLADLGDVFEKVGRGRVESIEASDHGYENLRGIYNKIFQIESRMWNFDLVTPVPPKGMEIKFEHDASSRTTAMLLLPTPLVEQTLKTRLIVFGISVLVVALLFVLWYRLRPTGSRERELPDDVIDSGRDTTEPVNIAQAPLTGMTLPEWRRHMSEQSGEKKN